MAGHKLVTQPLMPGPSEETLQLRWQKDTEAEMNNYQLVIHAERERDKSSV